MRAVAPLDPNVPLATPAKTSEIAAASMLNNVTQASQIESAAASPRRPREAFRGSPHLAERESGIDSSARMPRWRGHTSTIH